MPVTIRSLVHSRPLVVPLTTGTALRLSPGQSSGELPDIEVQDNPKIDKLSGLGLIEVAVTGEAAEAKPDPDEKPRKQVKG
jgi:hypothetical protein